MKITNVDDNEIVIESCGVDKQKMKITQREDGIIDYRVYNKWGEWQYCGGSTSKPTTANVQDTSRGGNDE